MSWDKVTSFFSLQGRTTIIPNNFYTYWPGSVVYYEIHSSLGTILLITKKIDW